MNTSDQQELNRFERAVLVKLLHGDHPTLSALREQLQACRVINREFTGHGFFTNLTVDPSAARIPNPVPRLQVSDVGADIKGLEHGAGFVLFVTDGYMDFLEGFTYDERWPDAIDEFSLRYELGRIANPGAIDPVDA